MSDHARPFVDTRKLQIDVQAFATAVLPGFSTIAQAQSFASQSGERSTTGPWDISIQRSRRACRFIVCHSSIINLVHLN